MKKNNTELSLEKKLISYSLMSTAFLALPSTLEAAVQRTNNVNYIITPTNSYVIDFNGDGTNDIEIYATTYATSTSTTYTNLVASAVSVSNNYASFLVAVNPYRDVAMLTAGYPVSYSDGRFPENYWAIMRKSIWTGQSHKYIAVRFPIGSGQRHIGFVEISVTPISNRLGPSIPLGSSITVHSYGYQDVAGAGIGAGELPVELTSFAAVQINNAVKILWETETEVDNYGFAIERRSSFIKNTWKEIGFVEGHGNSNSPKSYQFIDNTKLAAGDYYYRLKQIDTGGNFEYSDEVKVTITTPDNYALKQNYPNPFNPSTTIKFKLPESGFVNLTVYNTLGEEVAVLINQQMDAGSYEEDFNAVGLPSGAYIYRIIVTDKFTSERKMLLIK